MLAPVRFLEPGRSERFSIAVGRMTCSAGAMAHQDVVDGVAVIVALHAEAGGGVGLGVAIDQEDFEAFEGQGGAEIDGGGGFAHATLLIHDPDNFPHGVPE